MTAIIIAMITDASNHPDPSDIAAMTAIYQHNVLHSTASFEINPPSISDMTSQMMAVIGDSANIASIGLHSAQGFLHIGRAQEIGFKFGRRLDIVYVQRALQD